MRVRARMLWHNISRSQKVAALSCDSARLLYTWIIPHCDNLGRMDGDPDVVRGTVVPTLCIRRMNVVSWLSEMHRLGLIHWYEVEGLSYIQVLGWDEHQRIVGNMKRESDFPSPNGSVCTAYVRRMNDVSPEGEGEGEGEVEGEVEGEENPLPDANAPCGSWASRFQSWWDLYDKKVDRHDCEALWGKLSPKGEALYVAIMQGTERFLGWDRVKRGFKLDPIRFLKRRRWQDEGEPKTEDEWARWEKGGKR